MSSAEGFAKAMDISCHSFLRLARRAVPLMSDGGCMFAMSYHGANKVVPNYNLMGPVKGLRGRMPVFGLRAGAKKSGCMQYHPTDPDTRGIWLEGI